MSRPRLTIDTAKSMDFVDLVAAAHDLVKPYEAPASGLETEGERLARLERTLDELPDIYGWFLQLESFFDHWTDFWAGQEGTGKDAMQYKAMRQKRDAMERAASAAKLRYQGGSRVISKILGFDEESNMPRGR